MSVINVLLNSFHGLGLPPTLLLPLDADTTISSFASALQDRLPHHARHLALYTGTRRPLSATSNAAISVLADNDADFITLNLLAVLRGGKGGFGSQLRAAGGRMSSRKNRNANGVQRDPNASSRNLDGRRLRTVTEAKALAEYLAIKPEMDRKEREERRQRWESIVEQAEKRDDEIKNGKKNVRLDGEWVERKEEEESKTREAVMAMMREALAGEGPTGSESEEEEDDQDSEEAEAAASASGSSDGTGNTGGRNFFGWDEEELSEDEPETDVALEASAETAPAYKGKGKGRA